MDDTEPRFDFGEAPPDPDAPLFAADDIRRDCLALIAEARANVIELKWDARKLRFNRVLFPNVVLWLPDEDERAQLCFEFAEECRKIEALLAA